MHQWSSAKCGEPTRDWLMAKCFEKKKFVMRVTLGAGIDKNIFMNSDIAPRSQDNEHQTK